MARESKHQVEFRKDAYGLRDEIFVDGESVGHLEDMGYVRFQGTIDAFRYYFGREATFRNLNVARSYFEQGAHLETF